MSGIVANVRSTMSTAEFNSCSPRVCRTVGQDNVGSEEHGFRQPLVGVVGLFHIEADRDGARRVLEMEDGTRVDD